MKFDLRKGYLDYDGKPITAGPDLQPLNMRNVITSALQNKQMGPEGLKGAEEKSKTYSILQKVWKRWKVDLTHDECVFIKAKGAESLDALAYGRLDDFLEGREWDLPIPQEDQDLEEQDETKAAKKR